MSTLTTELCEGNRNLAANPHTSSTGDADTLQELGQPEPRVEHLIDWLTYTVPHHVGLDNAFLQHAALYNTGEVIRKLDPSNVRGYTRRLALSHGTLSFHPERPEQKICVQFSGRDLYYLRKAGIDLQNLLQHALDHDARITRMDFAVDYYGPSSPLDLQEAYRARELRSAAKKNVRFIMSCDLYKGEIIETYSSYFGSNQSRRMLRCYDKAYQAGVQDPWTRSELVMRDGYGNRVADAMVKDGIDAAGKQAIREFIQCDIDWFNRSVTGPSVYIQTPPPPERDSAAWLLVHVLPTFRKVVIAQAAEQNFEVLNAYRDVIQAMDALNQLGA